MNPLDAVAAVTWNLGIPTLAVLWLALAPGRGRGAVVLDVALAVLAVTVMTLTALWLAVPRWLILLPIAAIVPAVLLRRRRNRRPHVDPPVRSTRAYRAKRLLAAAVRGGAMAALVAVMVGAVSGRNLPPGEVVELASPLPDGTWLVASGGSTGAVNAHLRTLDDPSISEWRGQSYAVDLVGAGAWGSRTHPTLTPELRDFEIFDHPVVAPCSGRVVIARDVEPERAESSAPWGTRPGNHVVLECGDAWVLLAHFTRGSVVVTRDDRVRVGDPLARVGNTGASGEPHLHVHAQEPASLASPFAARPLPIRIDGRSLVRNDRLHSHGTPEGVSSTDGAPRRAPRPTEDSA